MKHIILLGLISVTLSFLASAQQLENPGFEDWELADTVMQIHEPVDWSSIKTGSNATLNPLGPVVWEQSSDAHSGDYSVKLTDVGIFGIVATGTITNGRIYADFDPTKGYSFTDPDDPRWNTPFTWRPDSIAGWFKCFPFHNDHGQVKAVLHVGYGVIPDQGDPPPNWVGEAVFDLPNETVDTWTRFSAPFVYYKPIAPEHILLILTSGNGTSAIDSSYAYYDDLEIIYNNLGVDDRPQKKYHIFSYGHAIYLENLPQDIYNGAEASLTDLSGRVVWSGNIATDRIQLDPAIVKNGLYVITIKGKTEVYSEKLYIH